MVIVIKKHKLSFNHLYSILQFLQINNSIVCLNVHGKNYKQFIQQTVNTKTWRVIYFHGLNEISEEQLRAILSTVKSYDVSQLEAVNYSQIYNMME